LQDLRQVGVVLQHLEVEGDEAPELGDRVREVGDGFAEERHPLRHLFAKEPDEDVVLRLEVEVDRAARHAGLPRDVRDAGVVVAMTGKHPDRGVDDLLRLLGIAHDCPLNRCSF